MKSVIIPKGVTSIEYYAFRGCSGLTNVYYTGTEEDWKNIWIYSGDLSLTTATITYNYVGD